MVFVVAQIGSQPEERASHSATLINNQIVIFGGITPSIVDSNINPLENAFALLVDIALVESAGFDPRTFRIPQADGVQRDEEPVKA